MTPADHAAATLVPHVRVAGDALDLERVATWCDRIRAGLSGLHDWIPIRPLSGAGVARWTGLKGPLCRRVLAAVQHRGDPLELARILPGIEGLTLFVDALEKRDCPPGLVERARQAIAAFAELQHVGGGSQRRLVAAIRERRRLERADTDGAAGTAAARRGMFEAASDLNRAHCEALVMTSVLYRSRERAGEVDGITALGRLGYRARPGAPPLTAKRYAHGETGEGEPSGLPGMELQERFGTPDLELTRTRLDGERLLLTCEGSTGRDAPVDLWIGPARDEGIVRFEPGRKAGYSSLAAVGTPSRVLVHELWIETALSRAGVLRAKVFRATPDVFADMDYEQWYDHLPDDPQILLAGPDPAAGLERTSPRHAEVLATCIEPTGLAAGDFVGYRCVVEHPIWMAVYRLTLEFDPEHPPAPVR